MSNIVEVKYMVRTDYCSCCDRPFDKENREIVERNGGQIDVKDMLTYIRCNDGEVFAEDLIRYVDEYTFEVLNDYISGGKTAYLEKTELDKVIKFAYEFIKQKDSGMTLVSMPTY